MQSYPHNHTNLSRGMSLVEAVVMIFVASICILSVWKIYTLYIKISLSNPALFQSAFLAEEGIEAVKFMRDQSWGTNIGPLSVGTNYTLTLSGSSWGVTTTPTFIDGMFDRRITFESVYRNAEGDISESGTLDPDTKKVVSTVYWKKDATSTTTRQISTYVADIFNN